MVELCGARLVPGTIDVYPEPVPPRKIELRLDRLAGLLGTRIPAKEVQQILTRLGFVNTLREERVTATVPYWRDADVQREADLIEEVARIHGLDKLPTTLPARRSAVGRLTRHQLLRRRLEDALRDRGLDEIVAWSFTLPDALARLGLGEEPALTLTNPLSEDQSVMRPLLLPGLLDAARHNTAHGSPDVALFESAHVYAHAADLGAPEGSPRGATPTTERHHLAALLTSASGATWRSEAKAADFFAAKGVLEAVVTAAGLELGVAAGSRPFLHPGRSADVLVNGNVVGWIGELHPSIVAEWDLTGGAAFEIDIDTLAAQVGPPVVFRDLTTHPAVFQDIAVVLPASVTAAEVEGVVAAAGGDLLVAAGVFDVYSGEQVEPGSRSLALRLEFRAPDRTLTDEEVARRRSTIEADLASKLGGKLRA